MNVKTEVEAYYAISLNTAEIQFILNRQGVKVSEHEIEIIIAPIHHAKLSRIAKLTSRKVLGERKKDRQKQERIARGIVTRTLQQNRLTREEIEEQEALDRLAERHGISLQDLLGRLK